MRDDPCPCRYYPRLELDPLHNVPETLLPTPALPRAFPRLLLLLLAFYATVAIFFASAAGSYAAPTAADAPVASIANAAQHLDGARAGY